jgi:hypothetical protein
MKPADLTGNELLYTILNFMADEARETGLPREYFEKAALYILNSRRYSKEERVVFIQLVKSVLDRAFGN